MIALLCEDIGGVCVVREDEINRFLYGLCLNINTFIINHRSTVGDVRYS